MRDSPSTRATRRISKVGASAVKVVAPAMPASATIARGLRGSRLVAIARGVVVTMTAAANTETSCPTCVTGRSNVSAMSGRSPPGRNSVDMETKIAAASTLRPRRGNGA
ncbi:hypothetical protein GCM10025877_20290 [Agromyces mangrovi Wang et al. 2018]|nr:hypothetical protein GCM10025877_20290 [Agromyces mangrovi]